jgi:hypothetical protein
VVVTLASSWTSRHLTAVVIHLSGKVQKKFQTLLKVTETVRETSTLWYWLAVRTVVVSDIISPLKTSLSALPRSLFGKSRRTTDKTAQTRRDAVVIYGNDAHYPSRDGFKTTGTRPQLQNVLSTNRTSNTIQTDIAAINTAYAGDIVGLAFEGRIYWALPIGSTRNNQIWVLDLDRKGAWMKPWSIMCDWMWLYNDNSGHTRFCMLVNNQVLELSYAAKTSDNGVRFSTSFNSGQVGFSEDTREWGRLIQLVFKLQRPQGRIFYGASVKTEDGIIPFSGSEDYASNSSRVGIDEPLAIDGVLRAIDGIYGVPSSSNPATAEFILEIDEDAQWYQYGVSSTQIGADYNFSDVISEYVPIGIKDLS